MLEYETANPGQDRDYEAHDERPVLKNHGGGVDLERGVMGSGSG
jgi:hypothetical protein